jgi:hypothetical protein
MSNKKHSTTKIKQSELSPKEVSPRDPLAIDISDMDVDPLASIKLEIEIEPEMILSTN